MPFCQARITIQYSNNDCQIIVPIDGGKETVLIIII